MPLWRAADYDVISAAYPLVTESFMKLAEMHQKEVYVWTVNKPTIMKQMIALGVSSIITDHPEQLVQVMSGQ